MLSPLHRSCLKPANLCPRSLQTCEEALGAVPATSGGVEVEVEAVVVGLGGGDLGEEVAAVLGEEEDALEGEEEAAATVACPLHMPACQLPCQCPLPTQIAAGTRLAAGITAGIDAGHAAAAHAAHQQAGDAAPARLVEAAEGEAPPIDRQDKVIEEVSFCSWLCILMATIISNVTWMPFLNFAGSSVYTICVLLEP